MESFNHLETKMFLLTGKSYVSKFEYKRMLGGFIIPLTSCISKIFVTGFLTLITILTFAIYLTLYWHKYLIIFIAKNLHLS